MPYSYTCPHCKKPVIKAYKPKEIIKCNNKGCGIGFPTPTASFLNSSVEEHANRQRYVNERAVIPKSIEHIDINDYLFTESEDSDDEKEETVKEHVEETQEKIELPTTRYERKAILRQRLIDDGVPKEVLDRVKGRLRVDKELEKRLLEEETENMDMDMDLNLELEEPEYYKDLNFSSDEEHEMNKENKSQGRNLRKRKGKDVDRHTVLPEEMSDDDSDVYQDAEEDIKDSVFSDMEEDSEEEIATKRRKSPPAVSTSSSRKSTTASRPQKNIREVYLKGGETLKFEVNKDGIEVPIIKKSTGPKKYKYGPKAGNRFNPFIVYNRMERRRIKDLYPELDNHDLSKKVGELYNLLSPEEKQKYIDMGKEEKNEMGGVDKKKDHLPKLPPTAFILYKSRNAENLKKELNVAGGPGAFTKAVAEKWKSLPQDEKLTYQVEAQKLKLDFMREHPEHYKEKMERTKERSKAKKFQNLNDFYKRIKIKK